MGLGIEHASYHIANHIVIVLKNKESNRRIIKREFTKYQTVTNLITFQNKMKYRFEYGYLAQSSIFSKIRV